jgi:hypothetical protein
MRIRPFRFRRTPDDPGERWAAEVLGPLRGAPVDIDITAAVMRRIAAHGAAPAPAPAPLPGRWATLSWAASLLLGFLALALLLATAGVMAFGGDQEARALWTLTTAAGRLAAHGYAHVGNLAAGLAGAAFAVFKGAWALVAVAAPLVRGAGFVAAAAGVMSVAISIYVFTRAWFAAPVADRPGFIRSDGGLA